MIILFCVIQAGTLIYAYSFVSYAARLGARYASVHGTLSGSAFTSSTVTSYVKALSSGLDTTQLSATATSSPSQAPGGTASVTVTYTYKPFAFITNGTVTLSSTAKTTINY
jgi:predicted trehalose synthase